MRISGSISDGKHFPADWWLLVTTEQDCSTLLHSFVVAAPGNDV